MSSLTVRQKKLLSLMLSEEGFRTIKSYSSDMRVSKRTIHNDLKIIKHFLEENNAKLQKKRGIGIKIEATGNKLEILEKVGIQGEGLIPQSTHGRKIDILKQLLLSAETTSLQKLSEKYMVSKSSLVNDLDKIDEWIEKYSLRLKRDRKGTKIVGDEKSKRKAIAGIIVENLGNGEINYFDLPQSRIEISTFNSLANMFDISDLTIIENIIGEAEKKLNYYISEPYYTNLITHVLILIKRIKSGNKINNINDYKCINGSKTFLAASFIAKQITKNFHIDIPENEIVYINQYILCSGLDKYIINTDLNELISGVDGETLSIVKEMIALSSKIANVELSTDKELYLGLLMHVKPMINRLRYSINIKNRLLNDIKKQYSAMFGMTLLVSSVFEIRLGLKVNEDEIGYLTVHFQAAVERQMTAKNVIVVCPSGIGTSELIAVRINRNVPQINVRGVASLANLENIVTAGIDFIISTVPIRFGSIPVVVISSLVNETDVENISNFHSKLSLSNLSQNDASYVNLFEVLDKDTIFCNLGLFDKDKVIDFMCNQLETKGFVEKGFKKTVIARENIAPTSIGNMVALPHGNSSHVNKSIVSIAVLRDKLDWGNGEMIKIIFMIALKIDKINTRNIIKDLYQLFDSKKALEKINSCSDPDEVYRLLEGTRKYLIN